MSCLSSGGGRRASAYLLDLDVIKSPSSSRISNSSSSPSSSTTLSESSNFRKPRTPRKRPNQTYNEAVAILSTAYPNIFPSTTPITNATTFFFEPSDLLIPLQRVDSSGFRQCDQPIEMKGCSVMNWCGSPEFDAESILEEEMGEGIRSIMGNIDDDQIQIEQPIDKSFCYGYPVDMGYGMRRESREMRSGDECDWWSFPSRVNVSDIVCCISDTKKKGKVEMEMKNNSELLGRVSIPNAGLQLKLNYDAVLNACSDKDSPFAGNDVRAQIELYWENGGVREASVLRYKEKRRTPLFSKKKKIRYEVRKVNADGRPRLKGRFVRTPNSSDDYEPFSIT